MITESEFIERSAELRRELRELKRKHTEEVIAEKQRHKQSKDNEYELHGLNMRTLNEEYYAENGRLMEAQTDLQREWAQSKKSSSL